MISLILSLISGLLTGLSFSLPNFSFLVWFSITPFIYVISRERLKISIFSALVFALAFYGLTLFWVANVTRLGLVLLLGYLSIYSVIFSLLGRRLYRKPLRLISLPCLWVVLEFVKENIWCGFGWANLGYSQYQNFHLIQVADLAGTKLISFFILIANVFLAEMVFTKGLLSRVKRGIFVVLIFLASFAYSFYRLDNLKELDSHKVSVVQPNIPQELKWEPLARLKIANILTALSEEAEEDSLVILPEAAWPLIVSDDNFYELEQFTQGLSRDILIGAVIDSRDQFFNAALLFNKEAKLVDTYRKIKLVPFGEYVPLREFLTFISVFNSIGDISRGKKFVSFPHKGRKFSALICFEDIFPEHVRRFAAENDFLVNITNDAWFKGEPQASQHLSIMALRAVENRISIIRSANTGISGWVSFRGQIEKFREDEKEVSFSGTKSFQVSLNKKRSFYNRYGDYFSFICALFLLGILIRKK